jgi:hypothetical protein
LFRERILGRPRSWGGDLTLSQSDHTIEGDMFFALSEQTEKKLLRPAAVRGISKRIIYAITHY